MFDLQVIGSQIVDEISSLVEQSILVTDRNGFIIASTNPERLNNYHEGAAMAIREKKQIQMTEELSRELKGVLPGIVLPIIIQDQSIGVIGITGPPYTVEKYGKLVRKVVELFVADFMSRQQRERSVRELEYFISDYLNGEIDQEKAIRQAELLSFPIQNYTSVAVFQATKYLDDGLVERMKSFQTIHQHLEVVRSGIGELIFLIPDVDRQSLRNGLEQIEARANKVMNEFQPIGVGQAGSLKRSYKQAKIALAVSARQKRIIFEEDLKLELLFQELPEDVGRKFIQRTLAPITEDEELLETLETYLFNEGSLQELADLLFIHKNTLKYRLTKIENQLGIHLHNKEQLTELYIAYSLYRQY
jgi:carbohydrate diacid regulator